MCSSSVIWNVGHLVEAVVDCCLYVGCLGAGFECRSGRDSMGRRNCEVVCVGCLVVGLG